VFAACRQWADVCRLQARADLRAGDRASTPVDVRDHGLERVLAQALGYEPRVAVDRSRPLPGLAEVNGVRVAAKQPVE